MPEIERQPVRSSNELVLKRPAEQPALMEKRLAETEVPAKSEVWSACGPATSVFAEFAQGPADV